MQEFLLSWRVHMKFPNTFNTRTERIEMWYEQIKDFLTNEKLLDLMKQFDFSPDTNLPVLQLLSEVKDFTEKNWSFRRNGGERTSVTDTDQKVLNCTELIIETAEELGLIKTEEKEEKTYDYIFPLGGFRAATYDRINWSKKYYGKGKIVALTGHREIQNIENLYLEYVPTERLEHCNEYLTACYAIEDVFGCNIYQENIELKQESQGLMRKYKDDLYVLCAPTPAGKIRANTLETLEYWKELFCSEPHTSILCITSPIYTSYQLAALAGFAIENELLLDFEACGECKKRNSVITNYLQEIKGTIDAFQRFAEKYPKE